MICNKDEVNYFLKEVHGKLNESEKNFYKHKSKKTDNFQTEFGITDNQIIEEIKKLDVSNYSKTEYDDNPKWTHEKMWIFGQMFKTDNNYIEVYIKLKMRKNVICFSFHPKEFDIHYPYN